MPNQPVNSYQANFTKGFVTEFTGLNFPENAATSVNNCVFTLQGDVTRRLGFDFEDNYQYQTATSNQAFGNYKWNNAGGDGETQIVVIQVGSNLSFFKSSSATTTSPLSNQLISISDLTPYSVLGTFDGTIECQFTDGNGYLFVFHPDINPVYVTYNSGTLSLNAIDVKTRDFTGVIDSLSVSARPSILTAAHQYNLQNQGWTQGNPWWAGSTEQKTIVLGANAWTIQSGIQGITNGEIIAIAGIANGIEYITASATITGYSGSTLSVNVFDIYQSPSTPYGYTYSNWTFAPVDIGYINTWVSAEGNYPSNSDVWWYFKDSNGFFNPATTQPAVTVSTGNAPQGHYILGAFNINRSALSGVANIDTIATNTRPTTGAFFQGRIWYSGVNDSQPATTTTNYYSWSENIYFSNIIETPTDFGQCYQTNDPTSEKLFDLLPSDGGVIVIQGSGNIYKLWPIQNGLLVFAANGVWFITGSTGIGFSANDYTVIKLSEVRSISGFSQVNVLGLPYFWNEEEIYRVIPGHSGQLSIEPISVGTIRTFYQSIPLISRAYAKGTYNPVTYQLQWIYRSTAETDITNRYQFDSLLIFNTKLQAFYTYSFTGNLPKICGILFVSNPGGLLSAPPPVIKYLTYIPGYFTDKITFSEERDSTYVDFYSHDNTGINFISSFTTGFQLGKSSFLKLYSGEGQKKMQVSYLFIYSRNSGYNAYFIRSLWDYASNSDSGRWSRNEFHENFSSNFSMVPRKYKPRGRGLALQFQVTSVDGQPFDIMGWSAQELINVGI